jgi:hypothetical protein
MLVAIGIDCIDSYKSNYHTITTMMTPYPWVTDDELYMLMGTNEERQNKNVILFFVFTEMVGETIHERKLKKTVSFDKLEMPSEGQLP